MLRFVGRSSQALHKRLYATIGIRREDKNCWERRVPLTPKHVRELIFKEDLKVIVQPSNTRCYSDYEFEESGAIIQEDLSEADAIFAVKEVPRELFIPDKTYVCFSHTIKAQPANMPMLDDILEKNVRLVDYERIVDDKGQRLVRFGPFAGYAGLIDTLHIVGERLLVEYGFSTQFINFGWSKNYPSLDICKDAIRTAGPNIRRYGFPPELFPMTFTITGSGSVSSGILELLTLFPHKKINRHELKELWDRKKNNQFTREENSLIYIMVAKAEDMVEPKDPSQSFDKQDYYTNPHNYGPSFHKNVLPYTRVLLNGMYWDYNFPRLISNQQAKELIKKDQFPLIAVGDISCDIKGSIEFLVKSTSISDPTYVYDIMSGQRHDNVVHGDGVAMLAVDHLPAEFPRSSSTYFGDALLPFVAPLAKSKYPSKYQDMMDELPPQLHKSIITANGKLTPPYKYIDTLRNQNEKQLELERPTHAERRVMILGSGYVVPPVVEYLLRNTDVINKVTIAGINMKSIKQSFVEYLDTFNRDTSKCDFVELDVTNETEYLQRLIRQHDLVISLVPAPLHPMIAKLCIKESTDMVTASYVSEEMKQLHREAEQAGIMILNEMGLDPGIDHLTVMNILSRERLDSNFDSLVSFKSYCGALPSPDHSNNALGYKFSWSPKGVLRAAGNDALFLYDSNKVQIPGKYLMMANKKLSQYPGFAFEMIPNRDSLKYIDYYGIDSSHLKTFMRGTLRFPQFCLMFRMFAVLELTSEELIGDMVKDHKEVAWKDLILAQLPSAGDGSEQGVVENLLQVYMDSLPEPSGDDGYLSSLVNQARESAEQDVSTFIRCMKDMGLWEEKVDKNLKVIDALCAVLEDRLSYGPREKDMIFMLHEFEIKQRSGHIRKITASLCVYGNDLTSATSLTVGLPVAIASVMTLRGQIKNKGLVGPNEKVLYENVLKELEKEGVVIVEQVL
ncbi:alpha-aminoadipic semialdehyde synthase [Acrasis kona]|uniref:Alpha-aminoadipic semialdehyde synthase n=1 Tax=Acrasis kona TaxID=1008807 RepID=A0AAW2YJK5_9EUKA